MAKVTINDLFEIKSRGEKFACLTAYDATFSDLISRSGVEVILVGDSLGSVIQGHKTTLQVTVNNMAYHTACVTKIEPQSLVITDLPFMSYPNSAEAIKTASAMMRNGAEMVKVEGGHWLSSIISDLVERGIPVCGHLGLTPQSFHMLGGYKVQGRTESDADTILSDALTIQEAGASLLVLECVPETLASKISAKLKIPVIGIGAGPNTDGQVLVLYDMLGLTTNSPGFSKNFLKDADSVASAIKNFLNSVKNGEFPEERNWYK